MNPLQQKAKVEALDDFLENVVKPFLVDEYNSIGKGDDDEEMPTEMPELTEELMEEPEEETEEEMPKPSKAPSVSIIDIAMAKPKESKAKKGGKKGKGKGRKAY